MPDTDIKLPSNILRNLCAIEFYIRQFAEECDLVGTMNFSDPIARNGEINAHFGIVRCTLLVHLSKGQMPLRFQLAQKQLPTGPVGDELRQVSEKKDEEVGAELQAGFSALKPKIETKLSGKYKEGRSVSGKSHLPEYAVHVDLCGDARAPAWRLQSANPPKPIVGTIREAEFGRVVEVSEDTEILVELAVHPDDFLLEIGGMPERRSKALRALLLKEIEFLIAKYGPISKQQLRLGA